MVIMTLVVLFLYQSNFFMELNKSNSPIYSIKDVKKQNNRFRVHVRKAARKMDLQSLTDYISLTEELLNSTQNIAIAMTERARLKILKDVLVDKMDHK